MDTYGTMIAKGYIMKDVAVGPTVEGMRPPQPMERNPRTKELEFLKKKLEVATNEGDPIYACDITRRIAQLRSEVYQFRLGQRKTPY